MRGACGHLCRFASASCSSLANSTYPFEHNLSSTRPEESCPQQAASPTSCLRAHSRTGLLWTTWSNSYKLIYQPFKPCNKTHQDSRRAKKAFKAYMRNNRDLLANHYLVNQKGISPSDMIAKMVDEHFRISCFSSKDVLQCEEILMWSHYANKHQGMRIKFSLNDMRTYPYYIKRIRYEKERIELD